MLQSFYSLFDVQQSIQCKGKRTRCSHILKILITFFAFLLVCFCSKQQIIKTNKSAKLCNITFFHYFTQTFLQNYKNSIDCIIGFHIFKIKKQMSTLMLRSLFRLSSFITLIQIFNNCTRRFINTSVEIIVQHLLST